MDGAEYALGLVVVAAYVGCAAWCGVVLRRIVVPSWRGPLALLAATILVLSVLVVVAEVLGAVGFFRRWALLRPWRLRPGPRRGSAGAAPLARSPRRPRRRVVASG